MPKLGDGLPYLGGNGLIATARKTMAIVFRAFSSPFLANRLSQHLLSRNGREVYQKPTRQGGKREESSIPQQQPIFTGGKLPLKPSLLLEAAPVARRLIPWCGAIALRLKICHNTPDLPNGDHLDAGKVLRLK